MAKDQSGVDTDQLVGLLVAIAAAELTTSYYYTILRGNLIGLRESVLTRLPRQRTIEDRTHFDAIVHRIYELGGKLPGDMKAFHDLSACLPANLPDSPSDIKQC